VARAAAARLAEAAGQGREVEIEEIASHAAADVIFRTLFSVPIEDRMAQAVFHEFRAYQRSQPILNAAAFVPLPRWMPRLFRRDTRASARRIRGLIAGMTARRQAQIAAGTAPDDLATKILTTRDPETGETFTKEEMVDQVAIFFLAGHETSASALGWALYLLACAPDWQDRVAAEARAFGGSFAELSTLRATRDVFRETLRLYPPVPMMVREATRAETFRDRAVPKGAQIVLSPWHLHRHERLWADPDAFDPGRWQTDAGRESARAAYMPFSAGPRVCTGAGFAMAEGVLLLAHLLRDLRVDPVPGRTPRPQAHLTVRARDGIWLRVTPRAAAGTG
jgi:cytochrome P450